MHMVYLGVFRRDVDPPKHSSKRCVDDGDLYGPSM